MTFNKSGGVDLPKQDTSLVTSSLTCLDHCMLLRAVKQEAEGRDAEKGGSSTR